LKPEFVRSEANGPNAVGTATHRSAICEFNAKGALSPGSLGQRPRNPIVRVNQALKARFTSSPSWIIIGAMPQSLSKVILHIVFSTKNREPWVESDVRPRMHAYLATICRDLGVELVRVGGVAITFTLLRRCRELFLRLN
jgi:hypothetical protein